MTSSYACRARRRPTASESAEGVVDLEYTRIAPHHRSRPYITVKLLGPNGEAVTTPGLVDTGADFSVLPVSIAGELGIPFQALRPIPVSHAAGRALFHQATEPLDAVLMGSSVSFSLEPMYAVIDDVDAPAQWGRDFFRHWDLFLSEREHRFSLTWRS